MKLKLTHSHAQIDWYVVLVGLAIAIGVMFIVSAIIILIGLM